MPLRTFATLLALLLTVAACAGPAAPDLADGDATVDEATTAQADGAVEDTSTADEAAPAVDGTSDGDSSDGAPADEPATVEALWWTAPTVDGGPDLAAAELAGDKVVLWMWAPWCSVCNREAPEVARALADLPDDVTVIGVAGRDDVDQMQAFVAEHGLEDMTHVVDADGAVWASYGISYQPAWVFIDTDGEAAVAAGALGYDGLFDAIDEVFGA